MYKVTIYTKELHIHLFRTHEAARAYVMGFEEACADNSRNQWDKRIDINGKTVKDVKNEN